jgi:hypothetical protein
MRCRSEGVLVQADLLLGGWVPHNDVKEWPNLAHESSAKRSIDAVALFRSGAEGGYWYSIVMMKMYGKVLCDV